MPSVVRERSEISVKYAVGLATLVFVCDWHWLVEDGTFKLRIQRGLLEPPFTGIYLLLAVFEAQR